MFAGIGYAATHRYGTAQLRQGEYRRMEEFATVLISTVILFGYASDL